ncbi:MAG: AraC family transcriptional regulator [bacterium]
MPGHKHPSSSYARILFRHLRLSEENSAAYFEGTNVSYEELMTLDGTIPPDEMAQIYRNALAIADLDDLGLSVGAQLQLSTHGPLGVAAFSGPDLRAALRLFAKYSQTRADFFNVSISDHPEGMRVSFSETLDLDDLRAFILETALIGLFSSIAFFVGIGQFKGRVKFSYSKPSYWQKYHNYFGDTIVFNQTTTEIIVSDSILATPSPVADPIMHQEAVAICEKQLQEITGDEAATPELSTQETITKLILENPGSIWTLKEVAAKLHISSRTLIRKLESEGTKFQIVRDELAKKQAANYLSDVNLSVESVGYLMGFSDVSSFRRSFKRWFGETPSQYIARVRGA